MTSAVYQPPALFSGVREYSSLDVEISTRCWSFWTYTAVVPQRNAARTWHSGFPELRHPPGADGVYN